MSSGYRYRKLAGLAGLEVDGDYARPPAGELDAEAGRRPGNELLEERGPDGDWTPEDYMGEETPEWATWGNGGFDPRDERVDRKGRKIVAS